MHKQDIEIVINADDNSTWSEFQNKSPAESEEVRLDRNSDGVAHTNVAI